MVHRQVVEVYFDHQGIRNGILGCWRARLADDHGCHDAGHSKAEAVENFMRTLCTFIDTGNGTLTEKQISNGWGKYKGMSKDPKDYELITLGGTEKGSDIKMLEITLRRGPFDFIFLKIPER